MKFQWVIVLGALSVLGCEKAGRAPVASSPLSPTGPTNPVKAPDPAPSEAPAPAPVSEEHALQVTVLNFLQGGLEQCELKEPKIFMFTEKDEDVKTVLCKNSKVEVNAVSNRGQVHFAAIDLATGRELPVRTKESQQDFELGKTNPSIRYYPSSPYGFTYLRAEEVTGIDPALLAQWNALNDRHSHLLAAILTAEQNGEQAPESVKAELRYVDAKMEVLSAEMEKTRKK
ncbi:MAG: hypothetical protein JST04_11030 [Bdellovibrionales bacterium]|nr:hypothetical protein [Bdellovibrionales bacterium]